MQVAQHQQQAQHIVQTHTVLQTINNPDGTVSLIQVDPGTTVTALTAADVAATHQVHHQHHPNLQAEATQAVATLAEVAAATQSEVALPQAPQATPVAIDINSAAAAEAVATLAEATLAEGGHILLAGDAAAAVGALAAAHDGTPHSGMVTIPVSMYQTVVTSIGNSTQPQQPAPIQQPHPVSVQQQQQQPPPPPHHQHSNDQEHIQEHQHRQESVPQVAMAPNTTQGNEMESDVPVATHAVEVVTLEQAN